MIKAILFDLDGVLIDSEYRTISIKKELLKKYNLPVNDEIVGKLAGKRLSKVVPELFPDFIRVEELLNEYQHLAYDEVDYSKLEMKDASETLRKLKENYLLALVTASNKDKLSKVFDQLHWWNIFDVVIDEDMGLPVKPDPQVYLKAMELLNVTSKECIIIEDSCNGIKAAKAARVKVIAKRENRYTVDQSNADEFIDDLSEIIDVVKHTN